MVWELGEEELRGENSQGRGASVSVGSQKNEHTINCSRGKSAIIMCYTQLNIFFFLCLCKLLLQVWGWLSLAGAPAWS